MMAKASLAATAAWPRGSQTSKECARPSQSAREPDKLSTISSSLITASLWNSSIPSVLLAASPGGAGTARGGESARGGDRLSGTPTSSAGDNTGAAGALP
jgi:hypothetical protein